MRTTTAKNNIQTWTEKLIRVSRNFVQTLYTKVQKFISKLDEPDETNGWTTEQLINMSESFAQVYCPGMGKFTQLLSPEKKQEDAWDTENLVKLGENLTDGFGQTVLRF